MKKVLIFASFLMAFVSCEKDNNLNENPNQNPEDLKKGKITKIVAIRGKWRSDTSTYLYEKNGFVKELVIKTKTNEVPESYFLRHLHHYNDKNYIDTMKIFTKKENEAYTLNGVMTFNYDSQGKLEKIVEFGEYAPPSTTLFKYDAKGRLIEDEEHCTTIAKPFRPKIGTYITKYEYDTNGHVIKRHTEFEGETIITVIYTYDNKKSTTKNMFPDNFVLRIGESIDFMVLKNNIVSETWSSFGGKEKIDYHYTYENDYPKTVKYNENGETVTETYYYKNDKE